MFQRGEKPAPEVLASHGGALGRDNVILGDLKSCVCPPGQGSSLDVNGFFSLNFYFFREVNVGRLIIGVFCFFLGISFLCVYKSLEIGSDEAAMTVSPGMG